MRKFAIIIAALLALAAIGFFSFGRMAQRAVEMAAREALGVDVTLAGASLSPFSGEGGLRGLVVGNPEGFTGPHAIKVEEVRVAVDRESLFSDTLVVRDIAIIAPEVMYEVRGGRSNIGVIADTAQRHDSGRGGENTQEAAGNKERQVVIERLSITGAKVVSSVEGAETSVSLPEIKLENIGKDGAGVSYAGAGGEILAAMMNSMTQANLKSLINQSGVLLQQGGESIKGTLDQLKGAFGQ